MPSTKLLLAIGCLLSNFSLGCSGSSSPPPAPPKEAKARQEEISSWENRATKYQMLSAEHQLRYIQFGGEWLGLTSAATRWFNTIRCMDEHGVLKNTQEFEVLLRNDCLMPEIAGVRHTKVGDLLVITFSDQKGYKSEFLYELRQDKLVRITTD